MNRKTKIRQAPDNYWDIEGSVEKDKKIKQSEVFGANAKKKPPNKKKPTSKKKKTKKKSY